MYMKVRLTPIFDNSLPTSISLYAVTYVITAFHNMLISAARLLSNFSLLCSVQKFQNTLSKEQNVMGIWAFARFNVAMSFRKAHKTTLDQHVDVKIIDNHDSISGTFLDYDG